MHLFKPTNNEILMVDILHIMIGLMLLGLGRRLFWLFVGCVGFVVGLQMAQLYLGLQPVWVVWAIALVFGLVGALLAMFFQTLAIGLGGFAAGSTIAAYIAGALGFDAVPVISFIGGIAGVVLLYVTFDWALIGLSSVAGSTLIVQSLNVTSQIEMVLYAVLIVAGIVFQATMLRSQPL
jgi:hypothetical protein